MSEELYYIDIPLINLSLLHFISNIKLLGFTNLIEIYFQEFNYLLEKRSLQCVDKQL